MNAIKQLFTPINYLRINHPIKRWFDYIIPLFLTACIFLALFYLPKEPLLFGDNGLIFIITDLIKILVGFYIASLAAVATFQRPEMDNPLSGNPATLSVKRRGKSKVLDLSRRQFLCYLFGYLAFIGMVIYFTGAASSLLADNFRIIIPIAYKAYAKWSFVFFYIFITMNMLTTTLLGLHYMTDRIHR